MGNARSHTNAAGPVDGTNESAGGHQRPRPDHSHRMGRGRCRLRLLRSRFGGEKTDSTGTCVAEFPKNMPGDTAGMVLVIAKILENETYGTVETSQSFTGGTPLMIEPKPKRGLGDTDAPLWMVYTLIVLLSGVWLHVIYVISLVIRINIIGKKALKKSTA